MVYTSEHQALAALEILNYWEIFSSLKGYHAYTCSFDEKLIENVQLETRNDLLNRTKTQAIGDQWIESQRSVVLRVPSVAITQGINYLLNPAHPQFYDRVQLRLLGSFAFDARVTQLLDKAKGGS